ncbi:hypothetical protein EXIGLDRAFT_778112 [Exidia glandulosa HHB12029]|uniref:Uncharacterized protein n=1 Tax=Exidia glandulosa HHB12029 TaxID=1314781 RepID=A0A165CQ95_EXIGL|nr:hypothetical protein EXIGLDRAFT_778112 [Exidia glandulosa HHB12029]
MDCVLLAGIAELVDANGPAVLAWFHIEWSTIVLVTIPLHIWLPHQLSQIRHGALGYALQLTITLDMAAMTSAIVLIIVQSRLSARQLDALHQRANLNARRRYALRGRVPAYLLILSLIVRLAIACVLQPVVVACVGTLMCIAMTLVARADVALLVAALRRHPVHVDRPRAVFVLALEIALIAVNLLIAKLALRRTVFVATHDFATPEVEVARNTTPMRYAGISFP